MNIQTPLYTWQHLDHNGNIFGQIKRFIDNDGRKRDIPFYFRDGNCFKAGIPEEIKRTKYPLFGLQTITEKKRRVIVCEGQKAQQAFAGLGFQSVTSILGATNAHLSDWSALNGVLSIYIAMDNDKSGETYAQSVCEMLQDFIPAPEIRLIRLPNLPDKGDICDWLKQQPELTEWNELDSLIEHPSRDILKDRLQQTIKTHLYPIPQDWINTKTLHINDPPWPEPEPISNELLPVMPLESNLIPEPLQEWIIDAADRMQCPVDFMVVSALVVIASLIGTSCGIKPKRWDNWLVIPNLWGGVVGRPGMLKTPAVSEVMQLLEQLEGDVKQKYDTEMHEYHASLELYKAEKEALKNEMITAQKNILRNKTEINNSPSALKQQFARLQEPSRPIWKRYKTNDATIEKLHELLKENPRGLLLYRDELMGLLNAWDKEGRETDRAFFLEAWNGYGSLTTDRIGRGTIHTENLCLSILGSTQPPKLLSYLSRAVNGGDNDGLLQRFQLMIYPDETKNWKLIDRVPNHEARDKAKNIIKSIAELDFMQHGASKEANDRFPGFRFNDDAQSFFYEWLIQLETIKLQQESEPILIEHLAKYRSLMPSLALIFHIIDLADEKATSTITLQSAQRAASWCNYLESHAKRIYRLGLDMTTQAAAKLAKKIQDGSLPDKFAVRDVYRKDWGLLKDKEIVRLACEELVEAGWLRHEITEQAYVGRPKSVIYLVNPKLKSRQ